MDFTLAIMAGGKSSRMGQNKALLSVGGETIIERIISRTATIGQSETILITNTPNDYTHLELPMFSDVLTNKGSLGGIYTAITQSKTDYTLVIACDMPFVSADLISYMLRFTDERDDYDVIVPCADGYPQGLYAIYRKTCSEPIRKRLDANQLKVTDAYVDVKTRFLDEHDYQSYANPELAFMNVNTPQELDIARRIAQDD